MFVLFRSISSHYVGAAFALASMIVATPLAQAASCRPADDVHSAFELEGLKSELMVTALSCQAQGRYNDFIGRFRPALNNAEKRLDTYFRSSYGRQAQKEHDDYITQLADIQSLGGLKSGTVFCQQRMPMFDEINALDSADDLAHYADAKDVAQPASYENCSAPRPSHSRHHSVSHRRHRR